MRIVKFPPLLVGFPIVLFFVIGIVVSGPFSNSLFRRRFWAVSRAAEFTKTVPSKGHGDPPVFAYWISGTHGETEKILRLLRAVYHPRNQYLLHLDAAAWNWERTQLALMIQSERVFKAFGNVDVVGQVYAVERTSSSGLAATLHAAAVLLKINLDWDWFIPLSASDYPIVTQDDLLHAFTSLPRDLNFVQHRAKVGWKEYQRINQIVDDPNLYSSENSQVLDLKEMREMPDAFKIFSGSPWVILSRPFTEFCVHGWDNLPRKLLLYFANVAFPLEAYFHTVLCNSPQFQNTTVSNDLRYIFWDTPPDQLGGQQHYLGLEHFDMMLGNGVAFARPFKEGCPVLRKLDEHVLKRMPDSVVPGKWCLSQTFMKHRRWGLKESQCSKWGSVDVVEPGPYGKKLKRFVSKLVAERSKSSHCYSSQ